MLSPMHCKPGATTGDKHTSPPRNNRGGLVRLVANKTPMSRDVGVLLYLPESRVSIKAILISPDLPFALSRLNAFFSRFFGMMM